MKGHFSFGMVTLYFKIKLLNINSTTDRYPSYLCLVLFYTKCGEEKSLINR